MVVVYFQMEFRKQERVRLACSCSFLDVMTGKGN